MQISERYLRFFGSYSLHLQAVAGGHPLNSRFMIISNNQAIADILKAIDEGRIQLPDFQRGWVWEDQRIRALIAPKWKAPKTEPKDTDTHNDRSDNRRHRRQQV